MISRRAFVESVAAIGGALVVGLRMSDLAEFSDGDGKASEIDNWITGSPSHSRNRILARSEVSGGVLVVFLESNKGTTYVPVGVSGGASRANRHRHPIHRG